MSTCQDFSIQVNDCIPLSRHNLHRAKQNSMSITPMSITIAWRHEAPGQTKFAAGEHPPLELSHKHAFDRGNVRASAPRCPHPAFQRTKRSAVTSSNQSVFAGPVNDIYAYYCCGAHTAKRCERVRTGLGQGLCKHVCCRRLAKYAHLICCTVGKELWHSCTVDTQQVGLVRVQRAIVKGCRMHVYGKWLCN